MDDDAREVLSVAGIARRFDADLLDLTLSDDDLVDHVPARGRARPGVGGVPPPPGRGRRQGR